MVGATSSVCVGAEDTRIGSASSTPGGLINIGTVIVDGCNAPYSYFLSVHTGCPGTVANEVACAQYGCGAWPQLSFDATAGEAYYIRVTGFSDVEISYLLTLTGPDCETVDPIFGDPDAEMQP